MIDISVQLTDYTSKYMMTALICAILTCPTKNKIYIYKPGLDLLNAMLVHRIETTAKNLKNALDSVIAGAAVIALDSLPLPLRPPHYHP